jgi:hypothetical protein
MAQTCITLPGKASRTGAGVHLQVERQLSQGIKELGHIEANMWVVDNGVQEEEYAVRNHNHNFRADQVSFFTSAARTVRRL